MLLKTLPELQILTREAGVATASRAAGVIRAIKNKKPDAFLKQMDNLSEYNAAYERYAEMNIPNLQKELANINSLPVIDILIILHLICKVKDGSSIVWPNKKREPEGAYAPEPGATYHSVLDNYQAAAEIANIERIVNDFYMQFKPKPRLTVSEWADRYRYLPSESASEHGQWKTSRTPYLKDIMDAVIDPEIHTVVVMTCSQIGKSEALNNALFYFAHQDPCPILLIQPTLTDAEDYSKSRLAPSIRDSAVLREIFHEEKSRNSNNTIFKKSFDGGRMVLVGANSPSGLSSKPIRIVLADEIDRYEATKEGSPVKLADQRTLTFHNRKLILTSTPSTKGFSEIEKWYNKSDKRKYFVTCPECKSEIVLKWQESKDRKNVVWDRDENGNHLPETARYCCQECGVLLTDRQLKEMSRNGRWRATAISDGIAGFGEFSALNAPWEKVTMSSLAKEFIDCKGVPDDLKTFVNLKLGECWEDETERVNVNEIYNRREVYNLVVPREACFVTASVDCHKDRLEALSVAWGADEEAFIMEHRIFYGDTSEITKNLKTNDVSQMTFDEIGDFAVEDKTEGVWKQLDDWRKTTYEHESGELLEISVIVIDTGYQTDQVYNFVRPREREGVLAIKGDQGIGKPAVSRPSTKNKGKVHLYTVGTFTVKDSIKARLGKSRPGPGYFHFPDRVDFEFCEQLGSEKKVMEKGKLVWKQERTRNEAWDLLCYNFVALRIRFQVRDLLNMFVNKFNDRVNKKKFAESDAKKSEQKNRPQNHRRSGSFVKNW